MDPRFEKAVAAAHSGDLTAFCTALNQDPGLLDARSETSHPTLFQFLAVDGGLGKIAEPLPFVDLLLERGANAEVALVPAASVNARTIVDRLMTTGARIETGAPWTALEEALYWGHQDLARYLIDTYGAAVSSLRAAAQLGRTDLMATHFADDGRLLPSAGRVVFPFGDVTGAPGAVLNQALFLTLRSDRYKAAQVLLDRGADLNAIVAGHHERCTPLHQAIYLNRPEMVDWLLDRGARQDIEDPRFNATAPQWARHFGHDDIARRLDAAA